MWRYPDADAREAFVREIATNFSLIAPAGVGKTQSIVQRILEIARYDADKVLPQLVVVTYTRRAASEMQDRVYAELLAMGTASHIFEAMEKTFFGTIHAFCTQLLQLHGIYIGLPATIQLSPDAFQLWKEFLFSLEGEIAVEAGMSALGVARRHVRIQEFLSTPPPEGMKVEATECSFPMEPDFSELLLEDHILEAPSRSRVNVQEGQRLAVEWLEKFRSDMPPFLPLPCYSKGGRKFLRSWAAAFAPLRQGIQARVQRALKIMALKYQAWRLCKGRLLYSDQIAFTLQLLRHPRIGPILRGRNLSIILDEAQDTDPLQFEVLFEISGGRISLVGDPQQSIYGSRADLQVYQRFQKQICATSQGRELQYQVSFRCRSAILEFVNQAGPCLLNGENGQVKFIPLQSACEGDSGQVVRLPLFLQGEKVAQAKEWIACEVAGWLRRVGLDALRARDWSEVALLCPRKRWLETQAIYLQKEGFRVQIHSERSLLGDSPVYAWWTSLFWVLTHPMDFFEVVGLLREVFALRDSDLASLCRGNPLQLYPHVSAPLPSLQLLGELVESIKNLPLRSAVDFAIRKTRLLERLLSLPGEDPILLRNTHAELLTRASEAEVRGLTLHEFVQELRDNFECPSEGSAQVLPGAIQLITCQKAKGLEWDAIIVPYFYRKISFRMARSPVETFDEEELLASRIQEAQRLLYVTLTRARNTLVLVDDRVLFPPSQEKTKTFSFAQILGEKGLRAFEALPQEVTSFSPISFPAEINRQDPFFVKEDKEEVSSCAWLEDIRCVAERFPRKITPHSLVQEPSFHKVGRRDFSSNKPHVLQRGIDYGVWWHECAEVLPLHKPNWQNCLAKLWERCPDPERGHREWEVFSKTDLAKRLMREGWFSYREVPFFSLQGDTVVEGVIDFIGFDPEKNNWLLLDWKTDRGIEIPEFLSRYKDQIGAYAQCLRNLTAIREVEVGLYAVSLGEWIPLKEKEGANFEF